MDQRALRSSYGQALLWVTALVVLFCCVTILPRVLMVYFTPHNPARSQAFVIPMMFLVAPIISATAASATLLAFAMPQYLQRLLENALFNRFGTRSHIAILLALPMTALLTWYSFDDIVMNVFSIIFQNDDDQSYVHGITPRRYLLTLGAQTIVTLISLNYSRFRPGSAFRRGSAILAVALALSVGTMSGHSQIQVLGVSRVVTPAGQ